MTLNTFYEKMYIIEIYLKVIYYRMNSYEIKKITFSFNTCISYVFTSIVFATHEIRIDNYTENEVVRPMPRETSVVLSEKLVGSRGSYSTRFEVSSDLPFFKLCLENTCGTRITYTVTKSTGSGEVVIDPYTLDSGKQDTKFGYKSINDGGTFYVNVTSSDGRELLGNVGVRVSNRKFNELQQ